MGGFPACGRQAGLPWPFYFCFFLCRSSSKKAMESHYSLFCFNEVKMLRQEIVACQKCGSLKELGDDFDCSDEKERSLETKDHNHGKK